jgi:hypothetical protein
MVVPSVMPEQQVEVPDGLSKCTIIRHPTGFTALDDQLHMQGVVVRQTFRIMVRVGSLMLVDTDQRVQPCDSSMVYY